MAQTKGTARNAIPKTKVESGRSRWYWYRWTVSNDIYISFVLKFVRTDASGNNFSVLYSMMSSLESSAALYVSETICKSSMFNTTCATITNFV